MNAEITQAPMGGENAGLITFDLNCTSCGYNLRGLREGGVCPECANPIGRSLRGDLLIYADPAWLRRLHLGARLMLWCIVIGLAAGLLTGVASAMGLPITMTMLPLLAVGVFNLWAVYCLTTQEPRTTGTEESLTLRGVIRVSAIVGLAGGLAGMMLMYGGYLFAVQINTVLCEALSIVTVLGVCTYLRRFALRIPDDTLARSTRIVMWGQVASLFSIVVMGIATAAGLSMVGPAGPAGPVGPSTLALGVMGVFGCLGGVLGLVFGIWYIVLLLRYRDAFKIAAGQSASDLAARRGDVAVGRQL